MSARGELVGVFRARLLEALTTADGDWVVQWDNRIPYDGPEAPASPVTGDALQSIQEALNPGDTLPSDLAGGRRTTGIWGIELKCRVDTGITDALDLVEALERSLLSSPVTLTDGTAVMILKVGTAEPLRPDESDAWHRLPVVVFWSFTLV